jgi:UDP-N-acetylmuramoyl-L-alanyl-D-glutamate--2,6-diaminopimelate ligase
LRLLDLIDVDARLRGDGSVEITALSADSRELCPGVLFAALGGARTDGRRFIAEAIAKGAAAVLGPPGTADLGLAVPVVEDADPRRRLALMAARLHPRQPRVVAAVTGTNGKTSTAVFTRQLWQAQGLRAASLGTLGLDAPGRREPGALTTPDPIRLHALLGALAGDGVEHLVLEASSHGLDQRRLDGVTLAAAAFTNLSRDHLDYHGGEAAYLAAKRRLFRELLPEGAVAVLNADAPELGLLLEDAAARRLEVVDYGRAARRLRLLSQRPHGRGQDLELLLDGRRHAVALPLVGPFQAMNALAALGIVIATGGDLERAATALPQLEGASGRMQLVARHPDGAAVFVDYAHTPDALEQALLALRPHTRGRLVLVFGCGGDRDPGKRPIMGRIARTFADRVYVTDDNPRSEPPAAIRRAVLEEAPEAREVGDRAQAIGLAMAELRPGDVLLVAGKGHETGQTVGGVTHPFDDAVVCRAAAAALAGAAA